MHKRIDLWTQAERDALKQQILDHIEVLDLDIVDISVCGSFCFGGVDETSDMDVIVWMSEVPADLSTNKYASLPFGDVVVDITLRAHARLNYQYRGFELPKYSLYTGETIHLNLDNLHEWVNLRIEEKPNYIHKDWSDFIGDVAQLNLGE